MLMEACRIWAKLSVGGPDTWESLSELDRFGHHAAKECAMVRHDLKQLIEPEDKL